MIKRLLRSMCDWFQDISGSLWEIFKILISYILGGAVLVFILKGCNYDNDVGKQYRKGYEEGWEACAELTWDESYNDGYVWGYDHGWEDAQGGYEYDETPSGYYDGHKMYRWWESTP